MEKEAKKEKSKKKWLGINPFCGRAKGRYYGVGKGKKKKRVV